MTPGARAQAAVELLTAVLSDPKPAEQVVAAWLRRRRYVGSKDRAFLVDLVYSILRHKAQLTWWLEREGSDAQARHLVLAALALILGEAPSAIAARFDGGRHAPQPLDDGERELAVRLAKADLDDPAQPPAVRFNLPDWLLPHLDAVYGERLAAAMAAMNGQAPLDMRANIIKAEREQVKAALASAGLEAEETPFSPWGLRLAERKPIFGLKSFQDGLFEVQDEGSQLVAVLLGAKPGDQVVDFCAGAGGKSLAIGAVMNNKGRVLATDVSEARLKRMGVRMRRAGLHNVERRALAHERDPWVRRHKRKFDRVLVDAPCTGTGTWRRAPDAKWRLTPTDLAELTDLQARILESAARLVKPGGRLVYAVCSVLREEGEAQIARFAEANPDFRVKPVAEIANEDSAAAALPGEGAPYLRLDPAEHGTDGFFAAVLERVGDG